jgi:hypothetical protein
MIKLEVLLDDLDDILGLYYLGKLAAGLVINAIAPLLFYQI